MEPPSPELWQPGTEDDRRADSPRRRLPLALPTTELLLSGAFAGLVGKTVTAPIDRVRILYQVNPNRRFSLRAAGKTGTTILRHTGVQGLWRGNGASLLRVIPYAAISFTAFDSYERFMSSQGLDSNVWTRLIAGAGAGCTSTAVTYPLDLVRAQMAAHWNKSPRYPSYSAAFHKIVQQEGVGALYRGITPTLIGVIPYAGLSFGAYETLKAQLRVWLKLEGPNAELPVMTKLAAGAAAGLVAQSVTYPLHVIRRRMQVNQSYSSIAQAFVHIYRTEGLRQGLFKGVALTWLKSPLTVALSFTINDNLKIWLRRWHTDEAALDAAGKGHNGPRRLTTMEALLAGGIAGATAKTVIAPGDRIKILYQIDPERRFSFLHAYRTAQKIVKDAGVTGLWRGNGATLMRVFPSSAISYMTYERYERLISRITGKNRDMLSRFWAGAAAGATATAMTYPLDLLRARMAAHFHVEPRYPSYAYAFQDIVRTEGLAALFYGIRPTLIGVVPYAGLNFMIFHTFKAQIKKWKGLEHDKDIPTVLRLCAGGTAGLVAQSATYPLDILRRRMQVSGASSGLGDLSLRNAFAQISSREGVVGGLYKGLSMNWVKGPIAVAVSFTVNDLCKQYFREYN
eukprot:m.9944 g.9944  ORF g.9944 m.9944 type:complete len:625 (-) comp3649_c0_seq1:19-1893(-)